MFQLIIVALGVFIARVDNVSAQTATFTYTTQASDCTGGFTCTISASTVDAVLQESNGKLQFLKDTNAAFEVTWDAGNSVYILQDGSANTLTGFTFSGGSTNALTMTFPTTFQLTSAQTGGWTCTVTSDAGSNYGVTAAVTIANTDLGACGTTVTLDGCAQTVTCDLGVSVAAVQTDGGIIKFQKDTVDTYQIAAADDAVTSGGSTAVTGATASAPVAASGTDANKATVTIGSTGTWDATTIDGSWTCTVTGATKASYALASDSLSANSICTTISIDACAKTMTCDLGVSAATVQTQSGTIFFKRAGTTMFRIAASDDAVTSDGSAAVTGVTAAAPASTATADANKATLTFDATATFDSTLDGSWTCEVTGATAPNNVVSAETTLSTTCGAEMNKVAGLLVALMVAIKVLLF